MRAADRLRNHGSGTARFSRPIMDVAAQKLVAVSHTDRQPGTLQYGQIHDIITDIAYVRVVQLRFTQYFLIRWQLIQHALLDIVNPEFARAVGRGRRPSPRDDPCLETGLMRQTDPEPIPGMKRFGLKQYLARASLELRHVVDAPVRHHAIHIHQ